MDQALFDQMARTLSRLAAVSRSTYFFGHFKGLWPFEIQELPDFIRRKKYLNSALLEAIRLGERAEAGEKIDIDSFIRHVNEHPSERGE